MSFLQPLPYSPFLDEWIKANRDKFLLRTFSSCKGSCSTLRVSSFRRLFLSTRTSRSQSRFIFACPVHSSPPTDTKYSLDEQTDPQRCQWQRASDGTRPSPPLCSSPLTSTYRSGSPCPRSSRTPPPLPPRPSMRPKGGGSTTILLGRERGGVGR